MELNPVEYLEQQTGSEEAEFVYRVKLFVGFIPIAFREKRRLILYWKRFAKFFERVKITAYDTKAFRHVVEYNTKDFSLWDSLVNVLKLVYVLFKHFNGSSAV